VVPRPARQKKNSTSCCMQLAEQKHCASRNGRTRAAVVRTAARAQCVTTMHSYYTQEYAWGVSESVWLSECFVRPNKLPDFLYHNIMLMFVLFISLEAANAIR